MGYYVANKPLQKFGNFANVFWRHPYRLKRDLRFI